MTKMNLQLFAKGVSSSGKSAGSREVSYVGGNNLAGKNVNEVREFASIENSELAKKLGLDEASDSQINSLKSVFRGMTDYDVTYDNKPYVVDRISITAESAISREEAKSLGMRYTKPAINVSITTSPRTGNDYIDMVDTKYRDFMIGSNGGFYTYSGKSYKRVKVSDFKARYGSIRP